MTDLQVEVFTEGKDILQQGEVNEKIYFLVEGEVGVLSGTRGTKLATLRACTCLGEALTGACLS